VTVLFSHPRGSPFSYNTALAHFEARRLEAFSVPLMPSLMTLQFLESVSSLRPMAQRFGRRRFPALRLHPKFRDAWGRCAV